MTCPSRATLIVVVSKELTDRFSAAEIVRELTAVMNGRGGGRVDFAQGAGDAELLDAAEARFWEMMSSLPPKEGAVKE